jgi:hypothetical protein
MVEDQEKVKKPLKKSFLLRIPYTKLKSINSFLNKNITIEKTKTVK